MKTSLRIKLLSHRTMRKEREKPKEQISTDVVLPWGTWDFIDKYFNLIFY
mgnify:CR=1 FL=1